MEHDLAETQVADEPARQRQSEPRRFDGLRQEVRMRGLIAQQPSRRFPRFLAGVPGFKHHVAQPRLGMSRIFNDRHGVDSQIGVEAVDDEREVGPTRADGIHVSPVDPRFDRSRPIAVEQLAGLVGYLDLLAVAANEQENRLAWRQQIRRCDMLRRLGVGPEFIARGRCRIGLQRGRTDVVNRWIG